MKAIKTLLTMGYLPLLLVVLPQAYAVGLWLWIGGGHKALDSPAAWSVLITAVVGAAGYEAIYVGAVGWAEQGARTKWTWATAITAWLFSVAVAVYVYRAQGAAALLHAGFPTVAFFYTVTMHQAARQRVEEVPEADPYALMLDVLREQQAQQTQVLEHLMLTDASQRVDMALRPQEEFPKPQRVYACPHCGVTLRNQQQQAAAMRRGRCSACPPAS